MNAPAKPVCATACSSDPPGATPHTALNHDAGGRGPKCRGARCCISAACRRFIGFARRCAGPFTARTGSFERAAGKRSPRADDVPARFVSRSYSNHAGAREYKLFVPGARPERLLPLVLMLHGCNQTPDDFAVATRMNALADQIGFYVAYPAQPESANPRRCWNWFDPSHQRRERGEPAILAGIVRHLVGRYPINERRIYVAGLSAGAAMAVILGRIYPELFAAIGVHSGLPYGAAHDVRTAFAAMKGGAGRWIAACPWLRGCAPSGEAAPPPAIVFHGDRDAIVHPRNGQAVAEQSAGDGIAGIDTSAVAPLGDASRGSPGPGTRHGYTCTRFRSARAKVIVEQWLVHGGGHAWFGGDARAAYTDPDGPDASAAMLRFFFSHARPSPWAERHPKFLSPAVAAFATPESA